ncbi:MAG TPA: phosphoglycerate dehydrogenase [Alphaproteobacteria bacterium]|nr:phosphoglycerate dehydrogenase [Alphaproteobacteria bacterium]HOO50193.1 phosphoglycerate dehydrogenase [Alphaproteobacteria bacterium]
MVKVLIADKMDKKAEEIFKRDGIDYDVKAGLSPEELCKIVGEYDAIACRSSAKITKDVIAAAPGVRVIGRAGIGVDTIDVPAATAAGIVVMNTPFGNSITTAEHSVAMMMALARQIPQASVSTHEGKWEKSKFMGVELYAKVLGVIGCGNIGAIVANRALGLGMKVVAFDPFLTDERAQEMGVEKVELDQLYSLADFITIHVPKTDKTNRMIDAGALSKMKEGVRIINCARGGLIVESDLKEALDSGKVAGAALDVFETEPASENILFGHPNVICTPHLGASTKEAQVNVAIQVAEQISDFLLKGAVVNAINMPSISAEDAPKLKPYMKLAVQIGQLAGQIVESGIRSIEISYIGSVARVNTKPLTASLLAAVFAQMSDHVNMVNAPEIAKSKKIQISDRYIEDSDEWSVAISVRIECENGVHGVTGTLFAGREPRIVEIESVPIEAALTPHMLLIKNDDRPGMIGALGMVLSQAGCNIADFRLGRIGAGQTAVALISIDDAVSNDVFEAIEAIPQVRQARRLAF